MGLLGAGIAGLIGVGAFRNGIGGVQIIPNQDGELVIPSVIAFTETGVLVGNPAKKQRQLNLKNTFYDVKRLIGRDLSGPKKKVCPISSFSWDEQLEKDLAEANFPFSVVNREGKPALEVERGGQTVLMAPEELSAEVLKTLKTTAESWSGSSSRPVTDVVLACPVEFSEPQRTATIRAAELAGQGIGMVLVFDMGGGTLDVSLLSVYNNIFETMAISGDKHLGGEDLNQMLVDWMVDYFATSYQPALNLRATKTALQKVHTEVERVKLELSQAESCEFHVDFSPEDAVSPDRAVASARRTVARFEFESRGAEFWRRALLPVEQVLREAGVGAEKVDEVVLVGGSTRVPKVRAVLREYFGKEPNAEVDPDQAVAVGVAIQAGLMMDAWPVPTAAIEQPWKHGRDEEDK